MKNTLVVVTGLGCLKAYKLENTERNRTPRLELLEEFNNAEAHGRLVEKVSDLSGRFPRGSSISNQTGAMSDGERHNIELEQRKRLVREQGLGLAPGAAFGPEGEGFVRWCFAASQERLAEGVRRLRLALEAK